MLIVFYCNIVIAFCLFREATSNNADIVNFIPHLQNTRKSPKKTETNILITPDSRCIGATDATTAAPVFALSSPYVAHYPHPMHHRPTQSDLRARAHVRHYICPVRKHQHIRTYLLPYTMCIYIHIPLLDWRISSRTVLGDLSLGT